jgi:hypothetical protein
VETTHQYLEADLELKRRVLEKLDVPTARTGPARKQQALVSFLDDL